MVIDLASGKVLPGVTAFKARLSRVTDRQIGKSKTNILAMSACAGERHGSLREIMRWDGRRQSVDADRRNIDVVS